MKRFIYISLIAVILIAQQGIEAQTLKRKGMLGIMMQTLNDSIAVQHQLKVNSGVYITTVMPNSTFSNLNVKQGDVLTKLNGTSVSSIQDVIAITSQLYEGDTVKAEYYSNAIKSNNTAVLKGRPIETFENGNVTYGEVVYKDNILRSILVTPKGVQKAPVVYFLQGYTCGSVETVSDHNPMKKLMKDWLDAGFAVYRVEKPGVGDSQSKIHCSQISFDEELVAFKAGYKDLLQQKSVDTDNIFMFGHSMGGVMAPLLNEMKPPRGMLVYGTVGKNWYDYMIDLYTVQPKHFGVSDAQIKEDNKVNLKFNNDFLIKKLSGEELLKNKDYVEFFNPENLKNNQYIGRHFKFWQNLADIDIPKIWSKVKTNVLAMHGEFDIQAINPKGAQKITEIVNESGGSSDFILIKKTDHGFVNFESMHQNVEALGNGTYMQHASTNYSKMLGVESVKWMQSKIKK
jgi:dienelactone hydrolase